MGATNVGLKEDVGRARAARLCPASAAPPWQSALICCHDQSTHFVPRPLNPPLNSLHSQSPFHSSSNGPLCLQRCTSSSWLCLFICKHLRSEMQLCLALFITKSLCFDGVGLCEGAESPFSLQQSCHSSSMIQGGSPRANSTLSICSSKG